MAVPSLFDVHAPWQNSRFSR